MHGFALAPSAEAAGYRLRGFESIGSTNTEAMEAAGSGDPGRLWLAALEQTAGRGRRGRPWSSEPGNLAASLLLPPCTDAGRIATLGFVAGVALERALGALLPAAFLRIGIDGAEGVLDKNPARIALKWPNDVLLDGAKLAGILLEARKASTGGHHVVIGFGVNVVSAPAGVPYPATSLAALGLQIDAQAAFAALTASWLDVFSLWDEGRGVPAVLELWRQAAAGIGAPVAVRRNGEVVRGIFESIDAEGRLIVRSDSDVRVAIAAGDVHFGMTASVANEN